MCQVLGGPVHGLHVSLGLPQLYPGVPPTAIKKALLHLFTLDVVLDFIVLDFTEGCGTSALEALGEGTQVLGVAAGDLPQHLRLMSQVRAAVIKLLLGVQPLLVALLGLLHTEQEILLEFRGAGNGRTFLCYYRRVA